MDDKKKYSGLLSDDDGPNDQTAQQTINAAVALAVSITDSSTQIQSNRQN